MTIGLDKNILSLVLFCSINEILYVLCFSYVFDECLNVISEVPFPHFTLKNYDIDLLEK